MTPEEQQVADVAAVDEALEMLSQGGAREAVSRLVDIIKRTPEDYAHVTDTGEALSIEFWTQDEFVHYVTWGQANGGIEKQIVWTGNAYPRAHFYLGFVLVKDKQYERALAILEAGSQLQPTCPRFHLEIAHALGMLGRHKEAIERYDLVASEGPFTTLIDVGVARRGVGFVHIEAGDLDSAEASFLSSLEVDPDSENAKHELKYIEHLRAGGTQGEAESTETVLGGSPRKWWQFWK